MLEFDYRAACNEVAIPHLGQVAAQAIGLYQDLRDLPEFEELAQARSLDVPMPESLRSRFESLSSAELAFAAQTLHDLGHWGGSIDGHKDTRGAYWKFSNLADQVLRKRLGVRSQDSKQPDGYSFAVFDGALRFGAATYTMSSWLELGPATESFLEAAKAWSCTLPVQGFNSLDRASRDRFEACAYEALKQRPAQLDAQLSPEWIRALNVGKDYMRDSDKCSDACPECGKREIFKRAVCDHELTCSRYPMDARIDAVLQYGPTFGLTPAQLQAARAAIMATAPRAKPAHECLPGDSL